MSNEVSIRVTGTNTSGASVSAAKRDVKDLGDEAQKSAKRVVELGAAEEVAGRGAKSMAGKLDDAGDQASQLARKLLEATAAAKLLGSTNASPHTGGGGSSGGLLGGALKDAPKVAEKAGVEAAGTFASAFEGGLMDTFKALPPEAKAALGAAVGGAAIAAAPLIVSAINGAIVGGIGAGGLAAGIALQAKDPVVSGAFRTLGTHVMTDLQAATSPFKDQLLGVADDFGKTWTKITPNVKGFFSTLAPEVGVLGQAISKSVGILGPALEKAAGPASKVLDAVAAEIPEIAQQIGFLLDDITEHGDSAAEAIKFILVSVEALIVGFDILVKTVGPAADTIVHMAQAIGLIDDTKIEHVITQLDRTPSAATDAADGMNTLSEATYNTADAANQANEAFERLFGQLMGLDEANLQVAEDFRKLGKAIKQNKGSLDENTEAGENNRRTILGIVDDLESQREAAIANGNGTVEATRKANAAFLAQLQRVRDVAAANGANTAELDRMLARYRALAGMPDITKSVTLTTVYKTKGDAYGSGFDVGSPVGHGFERADRKRVGGIIGAASGGMRSGLIRVGEEGEELVRLPSGSQVYTHGQSMRMMGGGGAGGSEGGSVVALVVAGDTDSAMAEIIQKLLNDGKIKIRQSMVTR